MLLSLPASSLLSASVCMGSVRFVAPFTVGGLCGLSCVPPRGVCRVSLYIYPSSHRWRTSSQPWRSICVVVASWDRVFRLEG